MTNHHWDEKKTFVDPNVSSYFGRSSRWTDKHKTHTDKNKNIKSKSNLRTDKDRVV